MAVVETETVGFFSQLKDSIKGVLTGALLLLIAFPVMFFNEWNSASMAKALEEGRGAAVSVESKKVDSSNDGKLVHTTGEAEVEGELKDPDFGVTASAIKLTRTTEIYQWVEKKEEKTEKKAGGKKEKTTTYTYEKKWTNSPVDSSKFKEKKGHGNESGRFIEGKDWAAKKVTVGDFSLSDGLIGQFSGSKVMELDKDTVKAAKKKYDDLEQDGNWLYLGDKPKSPEVGDVRVKFEIVEPGMVSIVAKQDGNKLTGFKTSNDRTLEMLSSGKKTLDEMFDAAESANSMLAWIIRFVGLFFIFAGVGLIFKPLVVVADVIPVVGSVLEFGVSIFAGLVALACGLPTIALSWLIFNPWPWGVLLCLCGLISFGALGALGVVLAKRKKGGEAAAAA